MSGDDPPLVAGAIHGVRVWRIEWRAGSGRLGASVFGTGWEMGGEPTRARCWGPGGAGHRHRAPKGSCSCGLYAVHPWPSALTQLEDIWFATNAPLGTVAGIVEAWGRVELHADGFRAEYARPKALATIGVPRGSDEELLVERLAERHGAEVLRVDSIGDLIAHCREEGLGLDEGAVRALVPRAPDPPDEAPPGMAPAGARRLPDLRERVVDLLWKLVIGIVALAWYGLLALFGVMMVLAFVGVLDEDAPVTTRDLRVVEERLVRSEGELRYLAVVENTSADEAALRIFPRGCFFDAGFEGLACVGPPDRVDLRPSLGPGETGVVADRIDGAREVHPGDVAHHDVELVARREPMPAVAPPQPSFRDLELDRDRCTISVVVRSAERLPDPRLAVLVRDRSGEIALGERFRAGPIPAGPSRQEFVRGRAQSCPPFMHSVELFASPTPRELLGETPSS